MMRTVLAAVISVGIVSGCGGGGSGGAAGSSGHACVPGASIACACTNATQGAQVCTPDGAGYGACTCSSGPGTAGTTGAAGSGGTGGAAGSAGTAGASGAAGSTAGAAGGAGGGAAGAGGAGVIKSCSTWTTVALANFDDGTLGGLTTCLGCSGGGCPYVVSQKLYNPSQWNLLCYPGLSATETRAIRISFDVTDQGKMGGIGWDNFGPNLKTNKSGAICNDSSGTHGVSYPADVASLNGHWDLIRWGGNSFQFNLNAAPLGEIECALPALSGMAIDFHEGGTGLAQSTIDNFRVEVCAAAP
jgi:hypothetical protein